MEAEPRQPPGSGARESGWFVSPRGARVSARPLTERLGPWTALAALPHPPQRYQSGDDRSQAQWGTLAAQYLGASYRRIHILTSGKLNGSLYLGIMQKASRLKKELHMLATEPPLGITCWQEKDQMDDLRAQILGEANTPYEKGIFKLEVIIPERYPFEPPKIRFLTPIYHPNIDSSGRICLDVLKLPPKGAWRPSLNIATVLAAIRLLMSEPNPDDPLMADISSEFKYNKPVFLKKARQWTEMHAKQNQRTEEEMSDISPEASEVHNSAQKRKARQLGGIEKKFHPGV